MSKIKENKVSVITMGCSKNIVDSERILRQLEANNIKTVKDSFDADVVIINTCGFINDAKEESVNMILNAVNLKNNKKIKKIIAAGCLTERYLDDLKKEIPEVDLFVGTEKYEEIIRATGGYLRKELLGERTITTPNHYAYLKISEGCDRPCSFCAIPKIRGLHTSKPIQDLISEARYLASGGVKELIIIAQAITDYGIDIYGKRNVAELLRELSKVEGIEWIRLMYAYPTNFPDDLIDEIKHNDKILKYLDMPLQHISDRVLKSMRRGITSNTTRNLVKNLKSSIPDLILRTTLIAGYPNETEEDFVQLKEFLKEVKFDRVGVFTYSPEETTSAFILGDPIDQDVKESRKAELMEIQQEISLSKNEALIGKELKTLIDKVEGDYYIGRSYRDAPEVDGEVLIPLKSGNLSPGSFYNIKITNCEEFDLFGIPKELKT